MSDEATPVESEESTPALSETAELSGAQKDGDEATEAKETETKEKRRDTRAERRIARLTKRNAEILESKEQLEARLTELENKLSAIHPAAARPQRDDFESQEEYEDALFEWRDKTRAKPEPSPRDATAPDQALLDRFQSFIEQTEKEQPGFAKLVTDANFPLTDHGLKEIIEMGSDGAAVFAHLSINPVDAMRISRLSPRDQTIELEKLADQMDDKSSAPDPIEPVSGKDQPVVDEDKLSTEDWIKRRNKQVFGF